MKGSVAMLRTIGLVCLIAGLTQGCVGVAGWSEFTRADRKELGVIAVSGTTYRIFELRRSSNPSRLSSQEDPNAVVAVYAIVGPGKTLYCGASASGCEKAIREFNRRPYERKEGGGGGEGGGEGERA